MALQVEFHTGVGDDVYFAARLLRKAYLRGARVLVRGPSQRLAALDRLLWTQVEREFLPHLRWSGGATPPAHAARTPIWLVDGEPPGEPPPVLVNLGADIPQELEPFSRVIEIVSLDVDEVQRGRLRWRDYSARGFEVIHHARGDSDA